MQLAYYFDDLWLADRCSNKLQDMITSVEANYTYVATRFFVGLIALRVAFNATGLRRQKNISLASQVIKDMEQWTKYGGLNCLSKLLILKAEFKALRYSDIRGCGPSLSKTDTVDTIRISFDMAISTSMRSGFRNDAALACERASKFCERCMETDWALTYVARAIQYYKQWGACSKVEQLQANHSRLLTPSSEALLSGDIFSGQRRFEAFRESALKMHENMKRSDFSMSTAPTTSRFEDGVLMGTAAAKLSVSGRSTNYRQYSYSNSEADKNAIV